MIRTASATPVFKPFLGSDWNLQRLLQDSFCLETGESELVRQQLNRVLVSVWIRLVWWIHYIPPVTPLSFDRTCRIGTT